MLRFLREVNRLLARTQDELALQSETCSAAVASGLCACASVRGVDRHGARIVVGSGPEASAAIAARCVASHELLLIRGEVATLAVPLRRAGGVVAALVLDSLDPHACDPEGLAVLDEVAASLSAALDARVAHAELERERSRSAVLVEVGEAALGSDDALAFSERVTALVAMTLPGAAVGLFDVRPGGEHAVLRAGVGFPSGARLPAGPGDAAGRALARDVPVHVEGTNIVAPIPGGSLLSVARTPVDDGVVRFVAAAARAIGAGLARRDSLMRLLDANSELRSAREESLRAERLRALGVLASGIAHDFNNQLMSILGFTELLIERTTPLDSAKARHYVELVHRAAESAAKAVGRLREFYRKREPGETLEPVDVNKVVADAQSLTEPRWRDEALAAGRPIRFETKLTATRSPFGRPGEIRDVVVNLVLNAIDALRAGGTIAISTRDDAGDLVLEVTDNGVGMTDEVRRHAFEPYFTTKATRGSGLGLALVWAIVQRHGGHADLESAPGNGTKVKLRFPISPPMTAGAHRTALPVHLEPREVLLVDDDPSLRLLVTEFLAVDGHRVESVSDGEAALARLGVRAFDALVTDRSMPGMSGEQVAATARGRWPKLPIVMVTGFAETMEALPLGVDVVVSKPLSRERLIRALADAIGGRLSAAP